MIASPLLPEYSHDADGERRVAASRNSLDVHNPATGELLSCLPNMSEMETIDAVNRARASLKSPPSSTVQRKWLTSVTSLLRTHQDELARIITLEQGKPLVESAAEVSYAAGFFEFYADQLEHLAPQTLKRPGGGSTWTVYRRPVGVVGVITPWNFPLAMLAKKVAAAMAAGCSVVAKPSELTPLSAVALWSLFRQAGIPAGLMNLVIGDPEPIGKVLCEHPAVRMISFTGSTATGRWLIRESAGQVKRLALELGGNAPFIVFEDANLEAAVDSLIANKFRAGGQTCVCTNRVLVHREVDDAFTELLIDRVCKLRVGNGMEAGIDIGPLINRAAFNKVVLHVHDALQKGARRLFGREVSPPVEDWGCFFPPTVLRDVKNEMLVWREETFGPVLAVRTFEDESQAIEMANDTIHGLAAYVFTQDADRAQRVTCQLDFGHVGLNTGSGPTPAAPFGGMKQSGFGREGGLEGLFEFCELQTVVSL